MSILSDKTDLQVIRILTRCITTLDKVNSYKITKLDDFDISLAKNLLLKVIESYDQVITLNS